MKLREIQEQIIVQETLANLMAYYETWHQGSVGLLMSISSGFDAQDVSERLTRMKFEIDPEKAFRQIISAAMYTENEEEFQSSLRKSAAFHALNSIVEKDEEILNKAIFRDMMSESIASDSFFDEKLKYFFDTNIDTRVHVWKRILTDEMLTELRARVDQVISDLD